MKHQDYIDEVEFIGEFDGTYWNVWLGRDFWGVLPGQYPDILALWVHPEFKERVHRSSAPLRTTAGRYLRTWPPCLTLYRKKSSTI